MSFVSGLVGQAGRNATLQPWFNNTASPDRSTRRGEQVADAGFILGGGGAVATGVTAFTRLQRGIPSGGLLKGVHEAVVHGPSLLKVGALALAGVGVVAAATGVRNLFAKAPSKPPVEPPTKPPVEPPTKPPVEPPTKPPVEPPTKPPVEPPTKPPVEPPTKPPVEPPTKPPVEPPTKPPAGGRPAPVAQHVVKPGEYLSHIAECYDISWRDLYSFNRDTIGSSPDLLRIGQRLDVPPPTWHGEPFTYRPQFEPGHPTPGLTCPPDSPRAVEQRCTQG